MEFCCVFLKECFIVFQKYKCIFMQIFLMFLTIVFYIPEFIAQFLFEKCINIKLFLDIEFWL